MGEEKKKRRASVRKLSGQEQTAARVRQQQQATAHNALRSQYQQKGF